MSEEKYSGNEVLLLSGVGTMEAEIIISKLKSYGIPVLKKSKGIGGLMEIYTGVNSYGSDIYVPEDALELAHELLGYAGDDEILE